MNTKTMKVRSAGIVGTGFYVPKEIRTNEWFESFDLMPVNEIFNNTGVKERRISADYEVSSYMEAKALLAAVEDAGIDIKDVDVILDGPNLPDQPSPGNAALLQRKSGAENAIAIDVSTACISLITQLDIAWAMIASGRYKTVACVVASMQTKVADHTEISCMMLGDGAAAMIVQEVPEGYGILSTHLETQGEYFRAVGADFCCQRRDLMSRYIDEEKTKEEQQKTLVEFKKEQQNKIDEEMQAYEKQLKQIENNSNNLPAEEVAEKLKVHKNFKPCTKVVDIELEDVIVLETSYLKTSQNSEEENKKIHFFFDHGEKGLKHIAKHGRTETPMAARKALENINHTTKDIDFFITHQPSKVLTNAWRKGKSWWKETDDEKEKEKWTDIPEGKTYNNLEKYGNMGPASTASCLHEAVKLEKIKHGDVVVLAGPGAGLHHNAAVIKWYAPPKNK